MADEIVLTELRVGDTPRDSKAELDLKARPEISDEPPPEYPHGFHFALISASLMLSVFLTGLVPKTMTYHPWRLIM